MNSPGPLYIPTQPYVPDTSRVSGRPTSGKSQKAQQYNGPSFDALLNESVAKNETLRFSSHAQERARMRNIRFSEGQLARLGDGVEKVAEKGSREALVMVDNVAAVVSVNNKTVITVADTGSLKDNVFTGIDSAVVV